MQVYSDAKSLAAALLPLFKAGEIALFAGAGVSARANLPVWHGYLETLATIAGKYEPLAADYMRKRIKANLLLQAADVYTGCVEIPDGIRLEGLAKPFQTNKYQATRIVDLAKLPFDFIVTTNYDRSLHDACVILRKTSKTAELNDPTLKHAIYWDDFFIARVHGRSEVPSSIVLDTQAYASLGKNTEYADFLHRTFTRRSCVFVGFSFTDPAIEKILDFIASQGVYPRPHYAIVPASSKLLIDRMSKFNIQLFAYDDRAGHEILWQAFSDAEAQLRGLQTKDHRPFLFDTARRLLAVCYTGARMGSEGVALRHIIVQGVVLSALDSGIESFKDLVAELRRYMAVNLRDAEILVSDACAGLAEKKLCLRDGDAVVLVEKLTPRLESSPVTSLAGGIKDRLLVRYGYELKDEIFVVLTNIVEEVIVSRGFDLGAEFAGAERNSDLDVTGTIIAIVNKHLPDYWQDRKQVVVAAFLDLLRRPEPHEEKALAELGRLSFGIEVVLKAGRSTMYGLSLPEIVYLDANVLMPAITKGHPFSVVYGDAIEKLKHASQQGNRPARVAVADVFLEETVKHRQRAVEIVRELSLESLEAIRRPISYYGAEDVNVFVAAYSTWIAARKQDTDVSFSTFLSQVAPYNTEAELRVHLEKSGIEVISTKAGDGEVAGYADALDRILVAYTALEADDQTLRGKVSVLKRHEARQIFILERDEAAGVRCVFVTADITLRRAVAKGEFKTIDNLLLSHRNLVQLVDLLVGLDVDANALSRLLWTVKIADDRAALKDYLINRALQFYDAAMLLKLNDLIDAYVTKSLHSAKLEGVDLLAKRSAARAKTSRFLDRTEESLFSELAAEMKKAKAPDKAKV